MLSNNFNRRYTVYDYVNIYIELIYSVSPKSQPQFLSCKKI